jgi:LmbE family N-acetylglucosaminyl deacetylase
MLSLRSGHFVIDSRAKVCLIVAHPDDETIGFGGHLATLTNVRVVVLTDGAPHNNIDARFYGYPNWKIYADARKCELETALAVAGISPHWLTRICVPDKEAAFHLAELAERLSLIFRQDSLDLVITHAFEGGHADHDATAFAVRAALVLDARLGVRPPELLEMPFYFWRDGEFYAQEFADGSNVAAITASLSADAIAVKKRMIAAHRSQAQILKRFDPSVERFRGVLPVDFTRPPKGSDAAYHRITPLIDFTRWVALVREAATKLRLPHAF